jgi:ABC-2 type transporter
VTDGDTAIKMMSDFADLWERAATDGTPVRVIVGDDPVEFAEAFAHAYTGAQWIDKERSRLRSARGGRASRGSPQKSGVFERFQSMPIARSSVLWAHVLTSLVANLTSVVVVVLVALLMGFRSGADLLEWLAVAGILILFTLALTWLAVIPGLSAKSADGASAFAYPLIFLPLISSAFVPTDTMPRSHGSQLAPRSGSPLPGVSAYSSSRISSPCSLPAQDRLFERQGGCAVAGPFAAGGPEHQPTRTGEEVDVVVVRRSTGLTLEVSAGGLRCSRRSKWSRHPVNHSGPKGCKYSWTKSLSSREAHVCLDAGCEVVKEYGKLPEGE